MKVRDVIKLLQQDGCEDCSDSGKPSAVCPPGQTGNGNGRWTPVDGLASKDAEKHLHAGRVEETMKYAVIYHKTRTGYSAHAPDLPGCVAAARTRKETEKLMREAIAMHLESMREHGERIPPPVTETNYITVKREQRAS